MTDWNPQIVRIEKVEKHPFADALDIATVLVDYPVIIKRDEYKEGDLAGYIPIDTVVPDTQMFHFLCPKNVEKYEEIEGDEIVTKTRVIGPKFPVGEVPEKNRIIKAKKIRGIYSQGMLISEFFNEPEKRVMKFSDTFCAAEVGQPIATLLNLKKWEEEEEENVPGLKRHANVEKAPQGWHIPKYDIDSVRRVVNLLQPGEEIVLTEKIHGSNAGFSHDGIRLWVKSRNLYLKRDEEDMWWDIAIRYNLEEKLSKYPGMVFFGEIYGQVKKFRYDTIIEDKRLLSRVRFFDIWNTKTGRYVDYDERVRICTELGLDVVPELYRGPWLGKDEMYPYAEGLTTLGGKHIREGWVLNTVKERFEPQLNSRMQVKLVGEGYNLQK